MAIKIKKNGKIEHYNLHSTDVKVLDLEGKFKKKDLESVIREISDTEHIHIGEVDVSKDGIWIDDTEILDNSENNRVVEKLKEYVDKQVEDKSKLIKLVNVEVDFNKLEDGRYLINTSKESLKNAPTSVPHGGILTVNKCSDGLSQMLISDEGRVYCRKKWYIYWGEWNELMSSNQISNPNLLINGDFQVWQRGINFSSISSIIYSVDRWRLSGFLTLTKDDKGIKVGRSKENASGEQMVSQYIEETQSLLGKTLTLSFDVIGTTNITGLSSRVNDKDVIIIDTKAYDVTTTSTRITHTFTVPNTMKSFLQIDILFSRDAIIPMDQYVYINNVKLELGTVATPFVSRSFGEELALCKRYYQVLDYGINTGGKSATQYLSELDRAHFDIDLSTPMRILPTFTATSNPPGMRFVCGSGILQSVDNIITMTTRNALNNITNLLCAMVLKTPTTTPTSGWVDGFIMRLDSEIY